jgi:hypothetical protein
MSGNMLAKIPLQKQGEIAAERSAIQIERAIPPTGQLWALGCVEQCSIGAFGNVGSVDLAFST